MSKVYIAGAHSRGITMGHYLQYLDSSIEILAFLYDDDEKNPKSVNGIPVIKITPSTVLDVECTVYIGTKGIHQAHLRDVLIKCGMKHIIPVDVKLDLNIRNQYLKKYYQSIGRKYLKVEELNIVSEKVVEDNSSAKVYVAASAFDKPLKDLYVLADYEKIIQVGTTLSEKRLDTDCFDNIGDNISDKNMQFCELTGLYWIWKHAKEDIVGLVHYRRHFLIPEDWKKRMAYYNIDVLLPIPLYVEPNIEGNFVSRHVADNWNYMLEYLKYKSKDDYAKGYKFFKETALYSPCNMFIMKREILNELCTWMFPILFAVAKQGGTLEDKYQNRYPGFIAERLVTYFFEKNRDKYKVAYADKNFLQ